MKFQLLLAIVAVSQVSARHNMNLAASILREVLNTFENENVDRDIKGVMSYFLPNAHIKSCNKEIPFKELHKFFYDRLFSGKVVVSGVTRFKILTKTEISAEYVTLYQYKANQRVYVKANGNVNMMLDPKTHSYVITNIEQECTSRMKPKDALKLSEHLRKTQIDLT